MQIITNSPSWFILFCLLAGAVVAGILYFREKTGPYPLWAKWLMSTMRFIAVTILAFLLLSPLLRTIMRHAEKPVIIFALDNSASMVASGDSLQIRNDFSPAWRELVDDLSRKFDTRTILFGDRITEGADPAYSEKYTDFSLVFDELSSRYLNRNVGAIVIASDGIHNRGLNPAFEGVKYPYPIFTVALGDTTPRKDAILVRAHFNRITYLNNRFPVEAILRASSCEGENLRLQVTSGGQVLDSHIIPVTSSDFSTTHTFFLEANRIGVLRFSLSIDLLPNESNAENNSLDVFIEVLDARQKVLLLAASPHPDIGALKLAIEDNENYEMETRMADAPGTDFSGFNLLVLHQLPSIKHPIKTVLAAAAKERIPILVILGQQTDIRTFNDLTTGLTLSQQKKGINEAQAEPSNVFALFTVSSLLNEALRKFPPLLAPFADYTLANSSEVLIYQRIGTVVSDYPLLMYNKDPENRAGVICGEGIWRWRIQNYMDAGNHHAFNELINKTVQYLSVREDRSRFRISAKYDYPENEDIIIEAELYNEAYELVNTPDVQIIITDEQEKNFPYNFSRRGFAYHLNAGTLPSGKYAYEAKTVLGGVNLNKRGEFTISPVKAELTNTRADHGLLNALAIQSGGLMVYPSQMEELKDLISSREEIKPIAISQKKFNELIHIKAIFVIIIIMLSLEWFMRKWFGAY